MMTDKQVRKADQLMEGLHNDLENNRCLFRSNGECTYNEDKCDCVDRCNTGNCPKDNLKGDECSVIFIKRFTYTLKNGTVETQDAWNSGQENSIRKNLERKNIEYIVRTVREHATLKEILEQEYPDIPKMEKPGFIKAQENYRRLIGVKDQMEKDDLKGEDE